MENATPIVEAHSGSAFNIPLGLRMEFLRLMSWLSVVGTALCLSACSDNPDGPAGADGTVNATEFDTIETPAAPGSAAQTATSNATSEPAEAPQGETVDPATGIVIAPATDEATDAATAEPRTTLDGRWELVIHSFQLELTGLLLEFKESDDGFQVETIGESPAGWTLSESEASDDTVHLKMTDPQGLDLDFQGRLQDGVLRGNIAFGDEGLDLASLRPSTSEALDPATARQPSPGMEKIAGLQPDENLLNNLREIATGMSHDPLAYGLYLRIFNIVRNRPPAEWNYAELVDEYIATTEGWGERVVQRVQLDVAYTLAIIEQAPDVARKYIDLAVEELADADSESLNARLMLSRGLLLINSASEEDQQQGLTLLQQIQAEDPLNLVSVVKLAEYEEKHDNPQEALRLYASLASVPGVQGDMSKIANLWKDLGNDPQQLDPYLDEVYQNTVYHFAVTDGAEDPAADNQRVVLGELFTGASCPPCVAADIATGALELTYPESKFVMLRYHEHIPAPDPLTILDGVARLQFYEAQGTPSLYVNGTSVRGAGGSIANAAGLYQQLRTIIDPLVEQTTDISIELTADGNGDSLHLAANVAGGEEFPETWRLRLCLVEEAVHYTAPNGIRIHEMLVRSMPGGAEGIVAQEDGFHFEADITAAELLESLQAAVETAETSFGTNLPDAPRKLEALQLVAFLQDDLSLEVVQAASIPVQGFDASLPEVSESTDDAAATDNPATPQSTEASPPPAEPDGDAP